MLLRINSGLFQISSQPWIRASGVGDESWIEGTARPVGSVHVFILQQHQPQEAKRGRDPEGAHGPPAHDLTLDLKKGFQGQVCQSWAQKAS